MSTAGLIRFGEFVFDGETLELRREGDVVALALRPARVLSILLSHAGGVVSKKTLIEGAWDGAFVSDDALFSAIGELRHVLGDDAHDPRFVETVYRRGYRFIAPVTRTGTHPRERPPVTRGRRWSQWRIGTVIGGATGLVAFAFLLLFVTARSSPTANDGPRLHHLLSWRYGLFKPACSPHGEFLAAVAPDPSTGIDSLFLVRPGLEDPLQLTHGLHVKGPAPVFTPDGAFICFTVYTADGSPPAVWRVSVFGSRSRPFLEGATAVSFEPGGVRFVWAAVTSGGSEIRVRGVEGRDHTLAQPGYWPRWSPDGRWIAWTTSDPEGGDGHLVVARPDGTERRRLTHHPAQHYGLCWTRDASAVVLASDRSGTFDLWLYPVDGGVPRPLTVGAVNATSPAVCPERKRIVFCRGEKLDGLAVLRDRDDPPRWVLRRDHVAVAAMGPEGTVVAVLERAGGRELVLVREGVPHPEVVGRGSIESVSFLPEGALLVSLREGKGTRVERWGPGPSERRLILRDMDRLLWPVSVGSGVIAGVRRSGRGDSLVVVGRDGGEDRVLARAARIEAPRPSPDGRLVVFSGGYRPPSPAAAGVWIVPVDGSAPPRRLVADGAWPCWTEGGRSLVFARYFDEEGIWRVPLEGGEPERIRGFPGGLPLWFLDGDPFSDRLLAHMEVQSPSLWVLED